MKHQGRLVWLSIALCLFVPCFAYGVMRAADDLDREIQHIKANQGTGTNDLTAKLAYAEQTLKDARQFITKLDEEIKQLEKEKTELKQLQTALTSGLIAAVLGGLVAAMGKFSSRAERDLKRLEVISKVAELQGKQVDVPKDLLEKYDIASRS